MAIYTTVYFQDEFHTRLKAISKCFLQVFKGSKYYRIFFKNGIFLEQHHFLAYWATLTLVEANLYKFKCLTLFHPALKMP